MVPNLVWMASKLIKLCVESKNAQFRVWVRKIWPREVKMRIFQDTKCSMLQHLSNLSLYDDLQWL